VTNGSIQPRGKGTWRLRVSAGTDPRGNRRRFTRTVHCRNVTEAREELRRFVREVEDYVAAHPQGDGPITLTEWAETWLNANCARWAPGTLAHYKQHLEARILPVVGEVYVNQIERRHVIAVYRRAERDGLLSYARRCRAGISPTTVRRIHNTLSACLQAAVHEGLLHHNPARQVPPPKPEHSEARFYEPRDVVRLLDALDADTSLPAAFRVLVRLALATGARRGELLGLEWRHVDWEGRRITIEQALAEGVGAVVVKRTKSGRPRRLPLDPTTAEALEEWHADQLRARRGEPAGERDWVFTWDDGRLLTPLYVTRRFGKLIAAHGLPSLTFHGLRHTAATILIGEGIPLRAVSSVLGHAQTSTTANIYAHALEASLADATGVLARHSFPASGSNAGTKPGEQDNERG
jgi:integrase